MKLKGYLIAAFFSVVVVSAIYIVQFSYILGYGFSKEPSDWSDLGGYLGGVLGPILTFISIVLLIKSVSLQHAANKSLETEIDIIRKTEGFRTFETQFFAMLNAQGESFEFLSFDFGGKKGRLKGVAAVREIEDQIAHFRSTSRGDSIVEEYLEHLDQDEHIFNVARSFYTIVKLIIENLNDERGYTTEDRQEHIRSAISFTKFSQIRLIVISAQFLDFHSSSYLKGNEELNKVLSELRIPIGSY